MRTIPVGRFEEQVVGLRNGLWVVENRTSPTPEITRKREPEGRPPRPAVKQQVDGRRAQDMAGGSEDGVDTVSDPDRLTEGLRLEQGQRLLGIRHRVERECRGVLGIPEVVGMGCVLLLQIGRVGQQVSEQIGGRARAVHRSAEATPHQQREIPGVVDMSMTQDDGVQLGWHERRCQPITFAELLQPLE